MKSNLIALCSCLGLMASPGFVNKAWSSPLSVSTDPTVALPTIFLSPSGQATGQNRQQALAEALIAQAVTTPQKIARRTSGRSPAGLNNLALQLVNRDRQQRGLHALSANALLNQVAQQHAEDMIRRGYFSHHSPEGTTPTQRVRQAGGQLTAGENIMNYQAGTYIPQNPTLVAQFQDGFMNSPGHRGNILKSNFAHFGFGIASTPDKSRIVAVQLFGLPPQ